MVSYEMRLTNVEIALVEALKDVQHGEILDAELEEDGQPQVLINVGRQTKALLELIRDGTRFFHSIRVHQGEPTLAEVPYSCKGFKCRKAYKF